MIELRRGLIVLARPVLAAIQGNRDPAVVGRDHAPRISRINPQPVVVAVRNFDLVEQVTAVGGLEGLDVHDVHDVFVSRVGEDVHVIPRPLPQAVTGIDKDPCFAAIVGPVQPAVGIVRFDEGIHSIRICRNGNADASIRSLGQTMLVEPLPGRTAVVRAV